MKKHCFQSWAKAECQTCGWECSGKNAQGVGAKHAKHHQHHVLVAVEIECSYDGRLNGDNHDRTVKAVPKKIEGD